MHRYKGMEGADASSFFIFLEMITKESIQEIVENEIQDESMFLVSVMVHPGNRIVVEIDSDQSIGIDDCVDLSRRIESHLDREVEDFELEVGSVGLTSPLLLPRQYQKNEGNEVEVLTKDGRKLHGVLKSSDNSGFVLSVEKKVKPEGSKKKITVEEEINFLYDEIKYTKYSISF